MKHQMVINVTDPRGQKREVLSGGYIRLRDRCLNMLFGRKHRILILIPGSTVQSVDIKEVETNAETQQAAD